MRTPDPLRRPGERLWQNNRIRGKENTTDKSTIWLAWLVELSALQAQNRGAMTEPNQITAATYPIAVVMERAKLASSWQPYQWEAKGVVRDIFPAGTSARVMLRDERRWQILYPGLELKLMLDEAEGYYLNLTSPEPKVFVLWRFTDEIARPQFATVSYHEGARGLDSAENVDGVPMPVELLPWIGEFVEQHYRPEPEKKKRYASNKDSGRMGTRDER